MLAVDTNVLVRLVTADDPNQTARVEKLMRSDEVWVAKTVLLETDWVLRSVYGFSGRQVAHALRALAGLPTVHIEDDTSVARAIDLAEQGFDFADALHIESRGDATAFVSFDEKLVKAATRMGITAAAV